MNLKFASLSLFCLCSIQLPAQFSEPGVNGNLSTGAVEDKYLFPVNPGVVNTLAGTMGELRNTHFHSGLDIRTNNMIGIPILAAQRGYISRITKSAYSFGNVIYIKHPNGHTSLYAHLDQFKGAIADHVREEQYRQKSFSIDLSFDPNQFPVNRGDTIGLSGNTGSSNGPHLHFDIRDENMDALNPLQFGFAEVKDKISPVVLKVALMSLDIDSRINGRFGRFEFSVYKIGGVYTLPKTIQAHGRIGVEILAFDRMDNSKFQCGINKIEMLADSLKVFVQTIDKIEISKTRGILSLIDNKTLELNGYRFNKLFIDEGNPLAFYDGTVKDGSLSIYQNTSIEIFLWDSYGNKSKVAFTLKAAPPAHVVPTLGPVAKKIDYEIIGNALVVSLQACLGTDTIQWFAGGESVPIAPNYKSKYRGIYLLDLRRSLPDSILTCHGSIKFSLRDIVPTKNEYTFYSHDINVHFREKSLFDTLFLTTSHEIKEGIEYFNVGDRTIPLMEEALIEMSPDLPFDPKSQAIYRLDGKKLEYMGGKWENGKVKFSSNELGTFVIAADTLAPTIGKILLSQNTARFRIIDNLSGIKSFKATINGEWLLMNYDYKSGILQSEKLERAKPITGDFELKVTDYCGNERTFNQKIL